MGKVDRDWKKALNRIYEHPNEYFLIEGSGIDVNVSSNLKERGLIEYTNKEYKHVQLTTKGFDVAFQNEKIKSEYRISICAIGISILALIISIIGLMGRAL